MHLFKKNPVLAFALFLLSLSSLFSVSCVFFFFFFLPSLHPLPGSEPNPKANERIEKDWIFAKSWGSQDGPNGLSPPLSLTPQLSPKSEHLPPLQTHSSKAQGRWGIHCVGMALLLWKPMLRNLSELIHCGEQPSLGGGGEAKL